MPRPTDFTGKVVHGLARNRVRALARSRAFLFLALAAAPGVGLLDDVQAQQVQIQGGKAPTRPQDRPTRVPTRIQDRPQPARPRLQPPDASRFAVKPRTALEHWEAADFLIRTNQAAAAVPYLDQFLALKPTDETLIQVRDDYGLGSVLRLQDDPATEKYAEPILNQIAAAGRRMANNPARLSAAIAQLTRTPEEQQLGIEQLRQAGEYAVPPLLEAVARPGLTDLDRSRLVESLGRLDRRAVAPLIAALDSPNTTLAASAAQALGLQKDRRAVPDLRFIAARPSTPATVRTAAQRALAAINGQVGNTEADTVSRSLASLAWHYHRGNVSFPTPRVDLWSWTDQGLKPASVSQAEAASRIGLKLADRALELDPANVDARKARLSLALERSAHEYGPDKVASQDPDGSFAKALEADPALLGDLLATAIADGHGPLAEVLARAVGRTATPDAIRLGNPVHPLVKALGAPDRRVQFAAAETLASLDLPSSFPGSNRLVPVLSRFLGSENAPRALVLDANTTRASQATGALHDLGFDAHITSDGRQTFREAAETADVELILIDPTSSTGHWSWLDTLTNIRADARTAHIPVFLMGPAKLDDLLRPTIDRFPKTGFLVSVTDPRWFYAALGRELAHAGARPLTPAERQSYSQRAAALLARLAGSGGPFASQMTTIEPTLSRALNNPAARMAASSALGNVAATEAQRSLADVVLDPGKPLELRKESARQLSQSIKKFGPLVTAHQEQRLAQQSDAEPEPELRALSGSVIQALEPGPVSDDLRLRSLNPVVRPTFDGTPAASDTATGARASQSTSPVPG